MLHYFKYYAVLLLLNDCCVLPLLLLLLLLHILPTKQTAASGINRDEWLVGRTRMYEELRAYKDGSQVCTLPGTSTVGTTLSWNRKPRENIVT